MASLRQQRLAERVKEKKKQQKEHERLEKMVLDATQTLELELNTAKTKCEKLTLTLARSMREQETLIATGAAQGTTIQELKAEITRLTKIKASNEAELGRLRAELLGTNKAHPGQGKRQKEEEDEEDDVEPSQPSAKKKSKKEKKENKEISSSKKKEKKFSAVLMDGLGNRWKLYSPRIPAYHCLTEKELTELNETVAEAQEDDADLSVYEAKFDEVCVFLSYILIFF